MPMGNNLTWESSFWGWERQIIERLFDSRTMKNNKTIIKRLLTYQL